MLELLKILAVLQSAAKGTPGDVVGERTWALKLLVAGIAHALIRGEGHVGNNFKNQFLCEMACGDCGNESASTQKSGAKQQTNRTVVPWEVLDPMPFQCSDGTRTARDWFLVN